MKKFILIAALSFSAQAFAKTVTCNYGPDVQDATTVAKFKGVGTSKITVELSIPEGEFASKLYKGTCTPDKGAIELSITCNVFTSTDSGYTVKLFSPGGPMLGASVRTWTMQGEGIPEHLKFCK